MKHNNTTLASSKWLLPSIILLLAALLFAQSGYAQITPPQLPDGSAPSENFIGDMGKVIKGIFQLGIYGLLAAGFLVAGYLIITSALTIIDTRGKGGVGTFFLGLAVAFAMVLATTYFLDKGEDALDDIGTTQLYTPATQVLVS